MLDIFSHRYCKPKGWREGHCGLVSDGRGSVKQEEALTVRDCQNAFVRKRRNVNNDALGGTIENGVPVKFLAPAFHILHSFQFGIIAVGVWGILCP